MNPPLIAATTPPTPRRRWWPWLLAGAVALVVLPLVLVTAGVISFFRLGSEARTVRNAIVRASGVEWRPRVSANIGRFTCAAIRGGLSLARLPEEAHAAINTLRGVQVGIVELSDSAGDKLDRVTLLAAADAAMRKGGWDRVVGVLDGDDLVAVYVPDAVRDHGRLQCCVVVFDGRTMVVASVASDLRPLVPVIAKQIRARRGIASVTLTNRLVPEPSRLSAFGFGPIPGALA